MLEAAIALMEEVGEGAFTLRRLAGRIGCDPMAVLYHFKSKDGLFRAMAEHLTARIEAVDPTLPWEARLGGLAHRYRGLALASPRSFVLLQRFLSTGRADLVHVEMVHGALHDAGLTPPEAARLCPGWYAMVIGLAMAEVQGMIQPVQGEDLAEIEALAAGRHPRLHGALGSLRDLDPAEVFADALDCLHDGIRRRAAARVG